MGQLLTHPAVFTQYNGAVQGRTSWRSTNGATMSAFTAVQELEDRDQGFTWIKEGWNCEHPDCPGDEDNMVLHLDPHEIQTMSLRESLKMQCELCQSVYTIPRLGNHNMLTDYRMVYEGEYNPDEDEDSDDEDDEDQDEPSTTSFNSDHEVDESTKVINYVPPSDD